MIAVAGVVVFVVFVAVFAVFAFAVFAFAVFVDLQDIQVWKTFELFVTLQRIEQSHIPFYHSL